MKTTLKSTFLAAALTLATAVTMTAGQTIVYPDTAQAGVVSSVKNAAKKVGGAVKTTAKGIGAAAKAGGAVGKQVGVGVGSKVKSAAVRVGHEVANSRVGKAIKNVPKTAKAVASKVRSAVRR